MMKRQTKALIFLLMALIFYPFPASAQNILADKVISKEGHFVEYILPTKEGQDLGLFVDYPDCSDCPADTTLIAFPNKERPFLGERTYHLTSKEGADKKCCEGLSFGVE